jgi:hypothetical protein
LGSGGARVGHTALSSIVSFLREPTLNASTASFRPEVKVSGRATRVLVERLGAIDEALLTMLGLD